MRSFCSVFFLLFTLLFSVPAAADFETAVRAYESGDFETALSEFRTLAEAGDADAQMFLGIMYLEGQAIEMDMAEAIRWNVRAAEQGQMDAQYTLALIALEGAGGAARDPETALMWLRESARRGHIFAQFDLGTMYAQGNGVTEDQAEAARWFRAAADQGHRDAQFNLGVMHFAGRGVDENAEEALEWFQLAAEQGHRDAQYNVAISLLTGRVVERDPLAARDWLERAAEQDQISALFALGALYIEDNDDGIARDTELAAQYFRRAAARGHPEAQHTLAAMYAQGVGVEQNTVEAYVWNELAAQRVRPGGSAYRRIDELRAQLAEMMTQTEIERAEALADERAGE